MKQMIQMAIVWAILIGFVGLFGWACAACYSATQNYPRIKLAVRLMP